MKVEAPSWRACGRRRGSVADVVVDSAAESHAAVVVEGKVAASWRQSAVQSTVAGRIVRAACAASYLGSSAEVVVVGVAVRKSARVEVVGAWREDFD